MNVPGPEGLPKPSIPIRLTRVADHPDLAASLKRVALATHELVDGCDSASVTVLTQLEPVTMAATDAVAVAVDQVQYDADDGPCLTAARRDEQVRVDDLAADDRWPSYRDAGRDHGLASSLSVPLPTSDAGVRGALNVYSGSVAGFSARDVRLTEEFAYQAGVVVAYCAAFDLTANLTAAMQHRGVIERAKGILMAINRCSADEAFDILRQRSQAENRKLRDIAIEVVAQISPGR